MELIRSELHKNVKHPVHTMEHLYHLSAIPQMDAQDYGDKEIYLNDIQFILKSDTYLLLDSVCIKYFGRKLWTLEQVKRALIMLLPNLFAVRLSLSQDMYVSTLLLSCVSYVLSCISKNINNIC